MSHKPKSYFSLYDKNRSWIINNRWTGARSFTFTEPSVRVVVCYDDFLPVWFFGLNKLVCLIWSVILLFARCMCLPVCNGRKVNVILKQHYAKKPQMSCFAFQWEVLQFHFTSDWWQTDSRISHNYRYNPLSFIIDEGQTHRPATPEDLLHLVSACKCVRTDRCINLITPSNQVLVVM